MAADPAGGGALNTASAVLIAGLFSFGPLTELMHLLNKRK